MERNTIPTWKVLVALGTAAIPACSPKEPETAACTSEDLQAFYELVQNFADRLFAARDTCSPFNIDERKGGQRGQCIKSYRDQYTQNTIWMDDKKMGATYEAGEVWMGDPRSIVYNEVRVEKATGVLETNMNNLKTPCIATVQQRNEMSDAIADALKPFNK